MGMVPPRLLKPLRKCLQCHQMKREDFSDRCQACYEANEREVQQQIEAGEPLPLNRNLIGWDCVTSQPEPHDYAWYFLKWLAQWLVRLWQNFLIYWRLFNFHLRPAPYIQQMAKDVETPRLPSMDSESGISLNQVLLSMGHEPVPNGGQSNRALLTLMKSIEGEIVERKKMQANCEDMLFAAADWRKE